jgi:magnesium transporter
MLKTYQLQNGGLKGAPVSPGGMIPEGSLWIDLFNPTIEERKSVDQFLNMELPTRADMEEIEISSRIYQEDGGMFMTALVLVGTDSDRPGADAITFVLAREKLITLRYIDPQPFRSFAARCDRATVSANKSELVMTGILDAIVDRMADVLERIGAEVEAIGREIFEFDPKARPGGHDFQDVLRRLGRKNDLTGKLRESLLTISRILSFMAQTMETKPSKDVRAHLKTLTRDVQSLQSHSSYLDGKLTYLQDATLGLINIDQNNIIKIMSVAATVFLPPTLFASIWGMNFHGMPELNQWWGYPLAIVVMIASAVVPYIWFKRRGWL